MRKALPWVLGGYALLATAGLLYFALRPAAEKEAVVEEVEIVAAVEPEATPAEKVIARASDAGLLYLDRMNALAQFPRDASESEVGRLMPLVLDKETPPAIRNDALAMMVRSGFPLPGVLSQLTAMWKDDAEDPDWRNFCLQFLELAYARDADGQALAETTLLEAVRDPEPKFSGTALLSIARLGESKPEALAKARSLSEDLMERSSHGSADDLPVATALQVARVTGSPKALDHARRLAADERAAVMARLSALNVLGEMGVEADAAVLFKVRGDDSAEPQLRRVATHAVKRLNGRLGIRMDS